jgi:hypothetical protein
MPSPNLYDFKGFELPLEHPVYQSRVLKLSSQHEMSIGCASWQI